MTPELNEILEQHRLWVGGKGGKCANLCGADLINANLRGANLNRADLDSADLICADLTGADLDSADLTRANLTGANLRDANLNCAYLTRANLTGADLTGANLQGAYLTDANLTGAILPDISWIIPGCLVRLNHVKYGFFLRKEDKLVNFVQDSFGFFIQDNREEKTFDMLVGDRIIRGIPDWVKYTVLKQIPKNNEG